MRLFTELLLLDAIAPRYDYYYEYHSDSRRHRHRHHHKHHHHHHHHSRRRSYRCYRERSDYLTPLLLYSFLN
jgi:hypothetical protein